MPALAAVAMLNEKEVEMSIVKVHRYGVRTHCTGPQSLDLEASGKPMLQVATPPEFRHGVRCVWTPEELLVASLAACYELTVAAIAEYKGVPLHDVRVDATGHVERKDHQYRFMLFELDVELETDAGHERAMEHVADAANERCLVGSALDVPVRLTVEVRAVSPAAAASV
jgi:organic hydroperoxide reductase OsmC/OhrA